MDKQHEEIFSKWRESGVEGTNEQIAEAVHVLCTRGKCVGHNFVCKEYFFTHNHFDGILFAGSKWKHARMYRIDIIRLFLACDVMGLKDNNHIWNVAVSTYSRAGLRTEK